MIKTLDNLKKGQKGKLVSYTGQLSSKKKLMEMGLVKGVDVKVEKLAPLGDPIEIRFRGYCLTLRKNEAKMIEIDVYDELSNGK